MSNPALSLKCKPRQAREYVIDCVQAGLVPYIQGSPGIGKSTIIRGIADEFLIHLIDHRLSTSEPTDMSGVPKEDAQGFYRYTPFIDIFPLQGISKIPDGKKGWLVFLDEANAAQRQTQAASYKFVLDRMVGQYYLHEKAAIVMAGNLATDRAITNPISTAMQSRLVHIDLECDYTQWLEDVALPQNYDRRIIAFLGQYPEKLMDFRPDHHEKTFCCPRTWEFVNRLLQKKSDGQSIEVPITSKTAPLLAGTITSGVAVEFVQFTEVYSQMIPIKEIINDPHKCRIPHDLNLKWAVVTSIMNNINPQNFDALATYADRFDLSFKLLFYRSILVQRKDLRFHPTFGRHAASLAPYLGETPNFTSNLVP